MRAHEILPKITLAKIEKTGQVVQLVKHADQVGFSDERGWFLINTVPGADTGPSTTVKWIPDTTRFAWVKKLSNIDEAYIDTLKRGEIEIPVNSHALDRVIQREILPTDVDRILRKLDTVRDQLDQVSGNQKFWLYDAKLDVALGFQKSDTVNTKYYLNTVVGSKPHDGQVLVIDV